MFRAYSCVLLFQKYSSKKCTEFPQDLSTLTRFIANSLGYETYKAEAAIVNFYHLDSTLGGHTDHSEPNCEAPLFSIRYFPINNWFGK